jgi:N6-adenosine-specific RNA methylase IME4
MDHLQRVRLSVGDWVRIVALIVTIATVLGGAYLRHDRMLTQVLHSMEHQQSRLSLLEQRLLYLAVPLPPSGSQPQGAR